MSLLPNIDNLELELDTVYDESSSNLDESCNRNIPSFGVIPGNILGSKLGVKDFDWGVVAPKEYRSTIHSMHLPIRNKGSHILDPFGEGKLVGLYENIIPGEVYVDWISLFMPRIATLDLYVSPSMFSMIKDISKGKTDLMPHEHHIMTIWPRSWQGNNFLVTRGKIFETVGEGYVEIDGMLDGMELPLGLNDGIIHEKVKIKSMRRITSKMTIGAIHNNLVWNFTDDAVAYVPTISRPYGPTVMGQPFRHIKNMPRSIEYVKEEWDEYALSFNANKAFKLDLHSFVTPRFNYNHPGTDYDRPWKALKSSLYGVNNVENDTRNNEDFISEFWNLSISDITEEVFNFSKHNIMKHLRKMNFGVVPIAMTQSSRYRSEDSTLFKWSDDSQINLDKFTYLPYNMSDYSVYRTGSDNTSSTLGGLKSIYGENLNYGGADVEFDDRFGRAPNDQYIPHGGVIIDNKFMGIHNIRKLFPDDANVHIDKLVIPWLEEAYNDDTEVKLLDVSLKLDKLKYNNISNLASQATDLTGSRDADRYRSTGAKDLLMSVPLDYALNGAVVGNYEDLKKKWNYQGSPMIFKRKGGASGLGRVGLTTDTGYFHNELEEELVFYCPYKIPQSWITEGKVKLRVGLITEETFKSEMHTGNGDMLTEERYEHISLDPSGRDFLYPDTLNLVRYEKNTAKWSDIMNNHLSLSMNNYFFDRTDNVNYYQYISGTGEVESHISRCLVKRDYIQPVPAHKHTSELLKKGVWDFMKPNPDDDPLNLAYDMFEKNYSDYYNLASSNLGGSNRQLISYPKGIMMLSFTSDMEGLPHTPDTTSRKTTVESTFDSFKFDSKLSSLSRTGDVPDMLIEEHLRQTENKDRPCLTRIVIKDKMLIDAYKKAGPDASVIAISNIPLFLEGASYIGGTFPPESEYQELVNQVSTPITNDFFGDTLKKLDTIKPTYENMKAGCFNRLSTGFELDDVFIDNSHLFRNLSVFMQETSRYHNVMYRVNPHILEPMFRKGMTEFFGDVSVKMRPDLKSRHVIFEDHRGTNSFGTLNEKYQDLLNIPGQYDSRVGFWRRYNVTFPIINIRWCMQFAFDDMPKTITTIKGINLFDTAYIPDNLFPKQINRVVLNPDYLENEVNLREMTYKSMISGSAIWINKPCSNPNAVIEHNDLFKSMLVFTRDKSNPMFKQPMDEYYEWSIDNKVDGIQYNANYDKYSMYFKRPTDANVQLHYDAPFDMRVDEFVDIYSKWVVADRSVVPDDDIRVKWEIDLLTKENKEISFLLSNVLTVEYNGKVKDLANWGGLRFESGIHKDIIAQLSNYYIGSPVIKSIRVFSDVYVCPSPNWERGIWGILRGTLPKGADTRCVVIPQRCTEGLFYRDVDLSKGIVLGEYNGSLPEKLFWGTDKNKLNVSGIFTSTHNANPNSHRTRKRTMRYDNNDTLLHRLFPYLHLSLNDEKIITNKYKNTLHSDSDHKLVHKKYGLNMYKLDTPYVLIDDENSETLNKTERIGLHEQTWERSTIWKMCKRSEFATFYVHSPDDKSYVANTRPSVATVNDVSPLSIPHKFDEIDISKLGGFGDLHEYYSDDPFGITPYAYPSHRPVCIYNKGYTVNTLESNLRQLGTPVAYVLIMLIHNILKAKKESDKSIYDTIYESSSAGGFKRHLDSRNIKGSILTNHTYELAHSVSDVYKKWLEAADKRLMSFDIQQMYNTPANIIDASLAFIRANKSKILELDDRSSDYVVNIFKDINRIPRNYEDLWLNFTGKNIQEDMFRSTGDTAFPITTAIPVTSIFSKYTMLNGVAKTRNRDDYVFSEHRCGVLYDFYDRFVTSRFDQTEFDQSYYIIQSNIRRSNIYRVYHQGIDYKKGESYRMGYDSDYPDDIKLSEIITRLYGPQRPRFRTPNIRSVYTHGGENCTNRYSKMSMYYRSTLINETVGDVIEVGSIMPLVGPLYYNLYQGIQIPYSLQTTLKPNDDDRYNITDKSKSVIPGGSGNKGMLNLAMNASFGRVRVYTKQRSEKTTREAGTPRYRYIERKRGGVYKTIKEMLTLSPHTLVGSIINHYPSNKIMERDGNDPNYKMDYRGPSTIIHMSTVRLPEYYSNWSNGGYNSTSGHALYHYRSEPASTHIKSAEVYPSLQKLFLICTDIKTSDYKNRFIGNSHVLLSNGMPYTPPHVYPHYNLQANNISNGLIADRLSTFGENLTLNGLIYRSDYTVMDDVGASFPLNMKSHASLMRMGGGKRNIYNRFLYPSSNHYLSRKTSTDGYINAELPYRFDTNTHVVLSNIQSINSQAGDLDEVCNFEDVSSMVNNIVFSENQINTKGFKSGINTPAVVSPFLKSIEIACIQQYDKYSKLFNSYGNIDYLKNKSPFDVHTKTINARVTTQRGEVSINSQLVLARNFDPLVMNSSNSSFYRINGIPKGINYALEFEHMVPNVGPVYYSDPGVDNKDLSVRPLYIYPFDGYTRQTMLNIKNGRATVGHRKYLESFNKDFMPSSLAGILKLPITVQHISPTSGRMIYRYSLKEPYNINLSYYPCLNDITMDRNIGTVRLVLGRNRLTDIRAVGISYKGYNTSKYDLGRFDILPVVPDSLGTALHKTVSAWVNTDTVQRCSTKSEHELTISGQFLHSHIYHKNFAGQMVYRTCGQSEGYPTAASDKLPLKLNIERMCTFADFEPNDATVAKGTITKIGSNSRKADVNIKYNKVDFRDKLDLYSTFIQHMQHKPTNATTSDVWVAPNDRVGNGLSHIKSMSNIFEYMHIPHTARIINWSADGVNLALITGNDSNKLGGYVMVFHKSPLFMSRPLYINNTTRYNKVFNYTILNKADTPKLYDMWNNSTYQVGPNLALEDITRLERDYPARLSFISNPRESI